LLFKVDKHKLEFEKIRSLRGAEGTVAIP